MAKRNLEEPISLLPEEFDGPDELEAALAGLPEQDSQIVVYRVKGQGRPSYVATYSPGEFHPDIIKQNHGPGKYNFYAKRQGKTIKIIRFEIDGEDQNLEAGNIRVFNSDGKAVFASKQTAQNIMQTERVNSSDPSIQFLMNEIRDLKNSLQNANQGSTRKEFLEEFTMMLGMIKQLSPIPQSPVALESKAMGELFREAISIGADAAMTGGKVKTDWWEPLLEKGLPLIQQVISQVTAAKVQVAQAQTPVNPNGIKHVPNLPTNGIADTLPSANGYDMQAHETLTGFSAIAPMLKMYLPLVIATAARDGDPGSVVELAISNIRAEDFDAVAAWLEGDTWLSDLIGLDARIQLQAAWWHELRAMLLASLKGEQLPEISAGENEVN
jgi:hypothetical protein